MLLLLFVLRAVSPGRVSNPQPVASAGPVFLDQLLLQYWFQGPQDLADAMAASSNFSNTSAGMLAAYATASQFELYCSDTKLPAGG